VVTLLTDFGLTDGYVGAVKGVILGINPRARLVDLTHLVPPQDVRRGALLLAETWRAFPRGTVHLAVVDPGVGSPRRPIAVAAGGHYFVGPDNGLLDASFDEPGARGVVLTDRRYRRLPVSRTFHGRDLFGPVAAHCSRGVPLRRLGPPLGSPVRLAWPAPRRVGPRVTGEVLLIDRFGNALTNLTPATLPGPPAVCVLEVAGRRIPGVSTTYAARPPGSLGAVIDSSGRVEIFVRDGDARRRLGIAPGTPVSSWSRRPPQASARRRKKSTRTRSGRSPRAPQSRSTSSRPRSPSSGPPRDSPSRTSRRP